MGKQQYTRLSKGIEDTPADACGAVHPQYPQLTCISKGKCVIDSHVGIMYIDGKREIVVWGEFFEHKHPDLKNTFKIIPLRGG